MTAALCLVIIDGGCLHTDSNLSITTIELNIGEVYGLNYSAAEKQTLCFFKSSCTSGMGIDAYLDESCPKSCKQHPAKRILTISDELYFINIRLLAPNNSLDLAYVLRIGNGTEMYITVGDCSQSGPPFIKHMIFKQKPQLHIESTNNSKYKQQQDNVVAISFGITLPISIVASITVTCLVVHFKKLLVCCKSKKNTSKVQDVTKGIYTCMHT